jgi:hypothetical protein
LEACIKDCPSDSSSVFALCVNECNERCGESCTGGDDGADLETCVKGCPSESFSDCVTCCSGKFPSETSV